MRGMKKQNHSDSFKQNETRPGGASLAVTVLLAGTAGAAIVWSAVSAPSMLPATPAPFSLTPAVSTSPEVVLRDSLREIGLTPTNLAAVGFTPQQVASVINAASTHLTTRGDAYRQSAAAARTTRQQVSDLEALAQSGQATSEHLNTLAVAKRALTQDTTSHNEAKASLLAAAMQGIPSDLADALATLKFQSAWEVPAEYKVVARSEEDWLRLRDALSESRIAAASGLAPSDATTQFLADTDAHAAVANARARLEANTQAVSDAWNTAVRGG